MSNSFAGQSDMIEADSLFGNKYLLNLSGTVYKERFSNAKALLTILPPEADDPNPFLVTIEGFPQKNARNIFFWDSSFSTMESLSDQITSVLKRSLLQLPRMHFFYLSPVFFENEAGEPLRHTEILRSLEDQFLPTQVYAQAGKLRLSVHADTISGTVWLKGYDSVERAFVLYNALISGIKTTKLEPQFQLKEIR